MNKNKKQSEIVSLLKKDRREAAKFIFSNYDKESYEVKVLLESLILEYINSDQLCNLSIEELITNPKCKAEYIPKLKILLTYYRPEDQAYTDDDEITEIISYFINEINHNIPANEFELRFILNSITQHLI